MKKICLVGPVDKRVISYPLIKTLIYLGRTLVVTDDGVYRRFDTEYGKRFTVENVDFIITQEIDTPEVQDELKALEKNYDTILFITTNEVPEGCDKVINCKGVDKGFITTLTEKEVEKTEHLDVYITYSKLSDSSLIKIEPNRTVLSFISECEDMKEFVATKDVALSTMLIKLFETELDVPKATLKTLLLRKG